MRSRLLVPVLCVIAAACADDDAGDDDHDDDVLELNCGVSDLPTDLPLAEAKLNIEHNATDEDTGFQGFADVDGWSCLDVVGPDGPVLHIRGQGALSGLGLTELFFESVEPENADVAIEDVLTLLPEGEYNFEGTAIAADEPLGTTRGTALLTHDIPAAPVLVAPAEDDVVPVGDLFVEWEPVTETLDGDPADIISYQLIVEADEDPDPHQIGQGFSVYLPGSVTSFVVGGGFFKAGTTYDFEVLAIEASGNQTISSGSFETE